MQLEEKRGDLHIEPGSPYLLGATLTHTGCNFAIFSRHATRVFLLLFDHYQDREPRYIIQLHPDKHRTGDIWHVFVHGITSGQCYGYVMDGPYWPEKKGHRFNRNKLLLDPYAKAITGYYQWEDPASYGYDIYSPFGDLSFSPLTNFHTLSKSQVVSDTDFDWEGDKPLHIPLKDTIIYELHVRGYTKHPTSGVTYPGTYLGLIEKIPYLKELGITTVELLPIHAFNPYENIHTNPLTGERLKNFWGYSTLGFFAPANWYATEEDGLRAVKEFKTMVKTFHKAGIEVILDVVYNHTAEGNELGPTVSFRGIDNSIYYMLENGRYYKNYSGCGNTLNCNHPVVKRLILDSLRYWVIDMHVDGFRFDLAAILGRDMAGNWIPDYSILGEISQDPILSRSKIIAEGWDASGLYAVGNFPPGWSEWNGRFRDDVRSFVRSDEGKVPEIAKRICGSYDIFFQTNRKPQHSINFITSHDGFTLADLVSYNTKHNEANGENNQDGDNNNLSWNCGVEGETNDPSILHLRRKQMKNLITILMLSQGTPMIHAGDEFGFSKKGNNNTYCQDNEYNWLDWSLLEKNREFYEFVRFLIHFRKSYLPFKRETFFVAGDEEKDGDIFWHGVELFEPDWSHYSRSVAFLLKGNRWDNPYTEISAPNLYCILNAYWENLAFHIPEPSQGCQWEMMINTELSPGFFESPHRPVIEEPIITVSPRSIVVLIEKNLHNA